MQTSKYTVASYQSSSRDEIVMIVVKFDNNKNTKNHVKH